MQITLKNLRKLVRETLSETYLGTSVHGGLASTAFNTSGTSSDMEKYSDVPHDPVEIAKHIRALIGGDAGFPIGDWGDESFNVAAEAAADALVNNKQREKVQRSVRLYEHKALIKEAIDIIEEIESNEGAEQLSSAIDRVVKILDSIDMSLDLIYASVSGETGPISGTRAKQRFFGRAMSARSASPAETE